MKNKLIGLGVCFLLLLAIIIPIKVNAEEVVIDKIEIEGVDYSLEVGKEPVLNAHLLNYADDIILDEFFMSTNRSSTIALDDSSSDGDRLIKDYIYFYNIHLDIKEGSNLIFDSNTKFYINGELAKVLYLSEGGTLAVLDGKYENIIPKGYVASNELDKDFAKRMSDELNDVIVKAIKEGKVTFDSDETKQLVDEAIANNKEISTEIYVSESMTKSQTYHFYEYLNYDKLDAAIKDGQKVGAYYMIGISVFIDGFIEGNIKTIDTLLPITIPYPNGLPELEPGYERVWKVYRYHDGEIKEIDTTNTDYGIQFMNDKYSSFIATYEVVLKENTATETVNNPNTGDTVYTYIGLAIISLIIFIGVRIKEIKL